MNGHEFFAGFLLGAFLGAALLAAWLLGAPGAGDDG